MKKKYDYIVTATNPDTGEVVSESQLWGEYMDKDTAEKLGKKLLQLGWKDVSIREIDMGFDTMLQAFKLNN